MKISELIERLAKEHAKHGDIEVTTTGTFLPDGYSRGDSEVIKDVFESTVESMQVLEDDNFVDEKRLRLH